MKRILFLVVLLLAGTGVSSVLGATSAVRVRVAPTAVTAGQSVVVAAGVSRSGAWCAASLSHGAATIKLSSKKAVAGAASWRAKLPATAAGGTWTARVACAGSSAATARFTVNAL